MAIVSQIPNVQQTAANESNFCLLHVTSRACDLSFHLCMRLQKLEVKHWLDIQKAANQSRTRTILAMEFASVLGIAASAANIIELSTSCISSLQALRASYKISELNVQVSVTQLSTLKAALMQISAWQREGTESFPPHLGMELNLSLHSCKTLIDSLNDQLNPLRVDQSSRTLSFRGKAKFLWKEREWTNLQTLLNHQISAIHLFLTTMQWYIPRNNF